MRTIIGVTLLLAALPLFAQGGAALQFKVLDLVYHVEDIGGRVEDMRVRETDLETRLELNADVMFDFDKADLLPKGEEVLRKAAEYLQGKKGSIRIEGHTDAKGDDDYNQRLSLRRAESVRRWFTDKGGISASQMSARGFGEKNPIAPNAKPDGSDDPEGRQRNRRVEIVISK
jgi:outer membrane protein OmpA-like peptidoglycan-associated protein